MQPFRSGRPRRRYPQYQGRPSCLKNKPFDIDYGVFAIPVFICAYLLEVIAIRHHRLPVSLQITLHLIGTNFLRKITLDQIVANAVLKRRKSAQQQPIEFATKSTSSELLTQTHVDDLLPDA
jgi:hypothetical protein